MNHKAEPHIARNKLFANGNVSVSLSRAEVERLKKENLTDQASLLERILNVLDEEFDMVPVTGEPESMGNTMVGWRLYSYKTAKEYVLLASDLEPYGRGQAVRLYASEPSDETFAAMIWQGA